MRVLHVDTGREWRGGQTQMLLLARAMGADAHVAVPSGAPLAEALVEAGASVHPIALRAPPWGVRGLRALVESVKPDLIAAHTSNAHSLALLAAGGRPVVVHRRSDFRPRRDPLTRWKYRSPAGYVAVSHAVERVLVDVGVDAGRIAVVYDGVARLPAVDADTRAAVRRELGIPGDALVVGAVGAVVAHQGHKHLVEALAWLDTALKPWPINLHHITNVSIELNGDTATARCAFHAPMGREKPGGGQEIVTNGGYYFDKLVRTKAGWRIAERYCDMILMIGSLPANYSIPKAG